MRVGDLFTTQVFAARGVLVITACSWLLASRCVWGPSVHRRPGSDGLVLVDVCEVAVGSCEDDILFLCCIQYKSIHD